MAMTVEEFFSKTDNGNNELMTASQKCNKCSTPLQETITGKRLTPEGDYCSDCYFALFGEEVERSPIVMPRSKRRM
jgi:hypothetical protein